MSDDDEDTLNQLDDLEMQVRLVFRFVQSQTRVKQKLKKLNYDSPEQAIRTTLGNLEERLEETTLSEDKKLPYRIVLWEFKISAIKMKYLAKPRDLNATITHLNSEWLKTVDCSAYPKMYRGTNAWRLAVCHELYAGIINGQELPGHRVGDENKGLGSEGISSTTNLLGAETYATQSAELSRYLPTFEEVCQWKQASHAEKIDLVKSYTFTDREPRSPPSSNLVFSQLIRRGYHLTLNETTRPGYDVVVDLASRTESLYLSDNADENRIHFEEIIKRCDEFCELATVGLAERKYNQLRPLAGVAAVAVGYALDMPLRLNRPQKKGGYLPDEQRTDVFKVVEVRFQDGTEPSAFRSLCKDYDVTVVPLGAAASTAFLDLGA